jgi:putative endonuclease
MDHNAYWVYVLELADGRRYIGHTNNLERRLQEHRDGRSPYTRRHKIKDLIYREKFLSRSEAMKREKFLKTGKGREWLKQKLSEHYA